MQEYYDPRCETCGGVGNIKEAQDCKLCNGSGKIQKTNVKCKRCNGTGKVNAVQVACNTCNGSGVKDDARICDNCGFYISIQWKVCKLCKYNRETKRIESRNIKGPALKRLFHFLKNLNIISHRYKSWIRHRHLDQ